jgi:hypothetical protein
MSEANRAGKKIHRHRKRGGLGSKLDLDFSQGRFHECDVARLM